MANILIRRKRKKKRGVTSDNILNEKEKEVLGSILDGDLQLHSSSFKKTLDGETVFIFFKI